MHSDSVQFYFLCLVKSFGSNDCFIYLKFNIIVQLFSNQYLIIVQLLFSIAILEMYTWYFNPVIYHHLLSQ
jgi:hypothetical protein